jgi:hypothetical protein
MTPTADVVVPQSGRLIGEVLALTLRPATACMIRIRAIGAELLWATAPTRVVTLEIGRPSHRSIGVRGSGMAVAVGGGAIEVTVTVTVTVTGTVAVTVTVAVTGTGTVAMAVQTTAAATEGDSINRQQRHPCVVVNITHTVFKSTHLCLTQLDKLKSE